MAATHLSRRPGLPRKREASSRLCARLWAGSSSLMSCTAADRADPPRPRSSEGEAAGGEHHTVLAQQLLCGGSDLALFYC